MPELDDCARELKARIRGIESVASSCRTWLLGLPAGTQLEPVSVDAKGATLGDVRRSISACESEVRALKSAAVPSADICQRVEAAVGKLAGNSVSVSGVGESQELKIVWPNVAPLAAQSAINKSDLLPLVCALAPQAMISLVMNKIERMANTPLPIAERGPRMAALEAEVLRLQYLEEVLVARGDGERESGRWPECVLGVRRVVEGRRVRAA